MAESTKIAISRSDAIDKGHSLRRKVLLLLAVSQALLIVGLYWVIESRIQNGYLALEEKALQKDTARAHNALQQEIDALSGLVRDWAAWDQSHDFVRLKHQSYIDSNITFDVFHNIPLDAIAFYNNAGELVYGTGADKEQGQLAPLPALLVSTFSARRKTLLQTEVAGRVNGFLQVGREPWLLSSQPILTSSGEGPVNGTLIMARKLTPTALTTLSEKLLLELAVLPLSGQAATARHGFDSTVLELLKQGRKTVIKPLDSERIESYSYIRDINRKPIEILRLGTGREIIAQAEHTSDSLVVALAVLATVSTGLILLFLDYMVLKRLSRLNEDVHAIREKRDLEMRASVDGDDELGYFAESFNAMLAALAESRADLQLQRDRAATTLSSIHDGVISTDCEGRIEYINPAGERITGWNRGDCKGRYLVEVFQTRDEMGNRPERNIVELCLDKLKVIRETSYFILTNRRGEELYIEKVATPLLKREGACLGSVLVFRDITAKRAMNERLLYQAAHDSLTNLLNRAEFERRLQSLMESGRKEHAEHALLYIDLDRFKVVNDFCGHTAGDQLLQQLAKQMQLQIRGDDILGRLGGDEFGLLLKHCPLGPAYMIAEKIRRRIQDYRFQWEDKGYTVGASIGLVDLHQVPESDNPLHLGDSACYIAKYEGRNRVHIYQPEDQRLARYKGEVHWATEIAAALDQDRFILYAQEVRPLGSTEGRAASSDSYYEILLRMQSRGGELIAPGMFLQAAERYGLIGQIDKWVVNHFFHWLTEQCEQIRKYTRFSINLSGHSLGDTKMLLYLLDRFEYYSVPYKQICFEVTETAAVLNLNRAIDFITEMRDKGCSFALDDFGVGMSSFNYLKNMPIDILKIDGSFVRNIVDQPLDCTFVQSINEIGHAMQLKTVAEFVENEKTLKKLVEIGVDFIQGYGISKPVPLTEVAVSREIEALST